MFVCTICSNFFSFQPNQSLETALVNGCTQLSSLVAHSPEGWGSMVLQWSIRVLACLSSLNTSSSFTSSPHEKVQYWMEQPCQLHFTNKYIILSVFLVVKQLVGFVTTGIRHRYHATMNQLSLLMILNTSTQDDKEKEDGENCVQYLLAITNEGDSDLSWLLAHIMSVIVSKFFTLLLFLQSPATLSSGVRTLVTSLQLSFDL